MRLKNVDLAGTVMLVMSIILGFTGAVDWWVIILIWLAKSEVIIDLDGLLR